MSPIEVFTQEWTLMTPDEEEVRFLSDMTRKTVSYLTTLETRVEALEYSASLVHLFALSSLLTLLSLLLCRREQAVVVDATPVAVGVERSHAKE